jgi:hypothetical protein
VDDRVREDRDHDEKAEPLPDRPHQEAPHG